MTKYIKQKCDCGKLVNWLFASKDGRKICEYCATDKELQTSKGLSELNKERQLNN